jgi:hypothetical protein
MLDLIAKGREVAENPQFFRSQSANPCPDTVKVSATPQNPQHLKPEHRAAIINALSTIGENCPKEIQRILNLATTEPEKIPDIVKALHMTAGVMSHFQKLNKG